MQIAEDFSAQKVWSRRIGQPWHSVTLALVGIACVAFAVSQWRATSSVLANTTETVGSVIAQEHVGARSYPVVAFLDAQGGLHELRAQTSSMSAPLAPGQQVSVRYVPGAPGQAYINSFWELWLTTVMNAVLAVAFLGGALFLWFLRSDIYSLGDAAGERGTRAM